MDDNSESFYFCGMCRREFRNIPDEQISAHNQACSAIWSRTPQGRATLQLCDQMNQGFEQQRRQQQQQRQQQHQQRRQQNQQRRQQPPPQQCQQPPQNQQREENKDDQV